MASTWQGVRVAAAAVKLQSVSCACGAVQATSMRCVHARSLRVLAARFDDCLVMAQQQQSRFELRKLPTSKFNTHSLWVLDDLLF